jgi:hypothetical protein
MIPVPSDVRIWIALGRTEHTALLAQDLSGFCHSRVLTPK